MMMKNDPADPIIVVVLGKKAGTDQGMDLHYVPVHPVKQPWLEEDIIRNRHLAYIMNQATEPQSLHVFFTEPLFQPYTTAYFRYSQSMFECGVITVGTSAKNSTGKSLPLGVRSPGCL